MGCIGNLGLVLLDDGVLVGDIIVAITKAACVWQGHWTILKVQKCRVENGTVAGITRVSHQPTVTCGILL